MPKKRKSFLGGEKDYSQHVYDAENTEILFYRKLTIKNTGVIAKIPIFATSKYQNNMNFPENLRYTKDHEWIKMIDEKTALVGITDFAQGELGDIVYVEVETVGKEMPANAVFGTVEAVKTVSDLYLPVAGTITELNPALADKPELVNTDPYGEGWMIKMILANPADADSLMDAAAYSLTVS